MPWVTRRKNSIRRIESPEKVPALPDFEPTPKFAKTLEDQDTQRLTNLLSNEIFEIIINYVIQSSPKDIETWRTFKSIVTSCRRLNMIGTDVAFRFICNGPHLFNKVEGLGKYGSVNTLSRFCHLYKTVGEDYGHIWHLIIGVCESKRITEAKTVIKYMKILSDQYDWTSEKNSPHNMVMVFSTLGNMFDFPDMVDIFVSGLSYLPRSRMYMLMIHISKMADNARYNEKITEDITFDIQHRLGKYFIRTDDSGFIHNPASVRAVKCMFDAAIRKNDVQLSILIMDKLTPYLIKNIFEVGSPLLGDYIKLLTEDGRFREISELVLSKSVPLSELCHFGNLLLSTGKQRVNMALAERLARCSSLTWAIQTTFNQIMDILDEDSMRSMCIRFKPTYECIEWMMIHLLKKLRFDLARIVLDNTNIGVLGIFNLVAALNDHVKRGPEGGEIATFIETYISENKAKLKKKAIMQKKMEARELSKTFKTLNNKNRKW